MVALEEEGSFAGYGTQAHTNVERVGWMAFEPAAGNLGTINFEAGHTAQEVTHEPYTITFTQTFDFAPRFFARMATYRGTDSSQVRTGEPPNTKTVSVHVEEESCTDTEMNHAPEIVDYFVLDSRGYDGVSAKGTGGVLYAKSNLNRGCEGLYDATAAQLSGGAFFDSQETNPNTDLTGGEAGDQVGLASINFAEGDETATWQMDRCLAGHYTIVFSYGLASGDRPMSVSVNDEVVDGFMAMPETGSWSSYREVRVAARLKAGRNRITLSTIGFSGPNLDYMAVVPIGSNAAGDTVTIGESGVLQTIDYRETTGYSQETNGGTPEEQWQTVHLTEAFVDPVVIIGTSTARGTQPTVPRLRNIVYSNPLGDYTDEANLATDDGCNGHCFDVRMQEPSCLDDLHLSEEIHYIVLEAGAWYTDQGKLFQVGRLPSAGGRRSYDSGGGRDLAGGWTQVTYHLPFADDMVCLTTVCPSHLTTRSSDADRCCVRYRLSRRFKRTMILRSSRLGTARSARTATSRAGGPSALTAQDSRWPSSARAPTARPTPT